MPSMEELNNLDILTKKEKWGIDKRIPIALIVVVIFQTVAITWGAATLSNNVKNYGEKIVKLETNFERFVEKADVKFETQARHEVDKEASRREIDEIKEEMSQLDQRLRYLEKHIK